MAVSVKKVTLWRKEVSHAPGVLAGVLEPLAGAGANLRVVMGYAMGDTGRAWLQDAHLLSANGVRLSDLGWGYYVNAGPLSARLQVARTVGARPASYGQLTRATFQLAVEF